MVAAIAIAIAGTFYFYQTESSGIKPSLSVTNGKSDLITSPAPHPAHGGLSMAGKPEFQLGENQTTLNVAPGSSISGSIPLNLTSDALMRFYILDPGSLLNVTKVLLPPGMSVSMQVYGKQLNPEFLSDIGESPLESKVAPTSMKIGQTSIPYTITLPNDVPAGIYHFNIVFTSFIRHVDNGSLISHEGRYYKVTLNVQ